jgi:hypothetical protein
MVRVPIRNYQWREDVPIEIPDDAFEGPWVVCGMTPDEWSIVESCLVAARQRLTALGKFSSEGYGIFVGIENKIQEAAKGATL